MQQRPLGDCGLEFSAIGLGAAVFGRDPAVWGAVDDNESIAAIRAALDLGVNWIECAPGYGAGHAEEVVGRAIQDSRDEVRIVTRCGPSLHEVEVQSPAVLRDRLIREFESSLRRLRTDRVDLLLVQYLDPHLPVEAAAEALGGLIRQGKAAAAGLVGIGPDVLAKWRGVGPLHAVMARLNALERDAARDLLPFAQRSGIGFLAGSPLCRGLLGGRVTALSRFVDQRARDVQFAPPRLAVNLATVSALGAAAEAAGRTLPQAALGWILSQNGVTAVAVGAKRASQVRELVAAAERPMSTEQLAPLAEILAQRDRDLSAVL